MGCLAAYGRVTVRDGRLPARNSSKPGKGSAMKRREFLKAAGVGLTASAVAAPAIAHARTAARLMWAPPQVPVSGQHSHAAAARRRDDAVTEDQACAAAGTMFWFPRNTLSGSHAALRLAEDRGANGDDVTVTVDGVVARDPRDEARMRRVLGHPMVASSLGR